MARPVKVRLSPGEFVFSVAAIPPGYGCELLELREDAAGATALAESRPFAEAEPTMTASGRLSVQIINPGWGSSGYYSPAVLAEAATNRVIPAGTQMFVDHPSITEAHDRPERSIRDLAAVLVSDATVQEGTGALVAEAQVFGPYAPLLSEMREAIGLSIRGMGTAETGEAEGRTGPLITSLDEVRSVDFVTSAGRGGRILEVLESARHMQEAGVKDSDRREALRDAVRDAHGADKVYVWVRDYDDTLVYFERESDLETEASGIFQQPYSIDDQHVVTLSGDPVEVTVHTEYVPVSPAGSTTTTESQGGTMADITIDEAEHRRLVEDAGRVQALESERDTERTRAEQAEATLAEQRRRDAARPVIAEAFTDTTAPAATVTRVTESLLAQLTARDNGDLDTDALRTSATEARTNAETEIAEALAAAGVGKVRGFGGTETEGTATRESSDQARARAFGRKPVQEG